MFAALPPRNSVGKSNFAYWENFLDARDIQTILDLPEWNNLSPGVIGGAHAGVPSFIDNKIRKSNVAWLGRTSGVEHIWQKIAHATTEVNSRFFKFDLRGMYEPAQLTFYTSEHQDFYTWHIDGGLDDVGVVPRKLSMTLLLSDPSEFEGGEFQIKTVSDNPITVEQKKGRAWFFPSYHLHRVTPVTRGIRKSLVLWIGGPEFK